MSNKLKARHHSRGLRLLGDVPGLLLSGGASSGFLVRNASFVTLVIIDTHDSICFWLQ